MLLGLGLCISPPADAAVIPGLFNTGVDNAHTPLANQSLDPHYALVTGSPIVFGAELAVHLGADAVRGANGNYLTELPPAVPPTLEASAAEVIALAHANCPNASRVGQPKLVYFNPSLFVTAPADTTTHLAWQLTVAACGEGDWFYFIDAQSGAVLFRLSLSPTHAAAKDINIRTANNTSDFLCQYFSATEWFNQNGVHPGVTPDAEGTNAFNFTHQVYDFYFNSFHRHSMDGKEGTTRIILDDIGRAGNAAFSSLCGQYVFGNNFATLDVLAHEMTHGVNASSAKLVSQDQSGALNESYSDVMAAMIDTANWTIGEGLPGGAIRVRLRILEGWRLTSSRARCGSGRSTSKNSRSSFTRTSEALDENGFRNTS